MPSQPPQADALLALALDLLAQAEAHHRAANRLEVATRSLALARGAQTRSAFDMDQVRQVRAQVIALEDLSTANRNLLTEFNRELDALLGRARGA